MPCWKGSEASRKGRCGHGEIHWLARGLAKHQIALARPDIRELDGCASSLPEDHVAFAGLASILGRSLRKAAHEIGVAVAGDIPRAGEAPARMVAVGRAANRNAPLAIADGGDVDRADALLPEDNKAS